MKLTNLAGLGQKSVEKLAHFNIFTQQDLLLHLPFRYQNKTKFSDLLTATVGNEVLLKLTIDSVVTIAKNSSQLIVHLCDKHGTKLVWRFFHFNYYQRQQFVRKTEVECFGELKISNLGLEMFHPEYRLISNNQNTLLSNTLTPVYFCRDGISQNQLRKWIIEALVNFNQITENSAFKKSINLLHSPSSDEDLESIIEFRHIAQTTLIIQEFAARKLAMLRARAKIRKQKTIAIKVNNTLINKLNINFELTNSQQKVIKEIQRDINSTKPMLRLLQGDVGCGKTIVAIIASLSVVADKKQVAIMVPTTILSEQHLFSFKEILQPLGINIAFLVGSQNTQQTKENLNLIKGKADIIIGTHALLQKNVIFRDLALVIIDEQHKFGVEQRLKLIQKGRNPPHTLAMTATPIPRSIMMSIYGEMDISIINELPKGRKKTQTIAINIDKKLTLLEKVRQVCKNNSQVYWVCVLIDESENFNATPVVDSFDFLCKNLPEFKVELLHSKIDKVNKQRVMQDFTTGKINVLVATTVIEVGVNVANANFMVVENAEKLGLAQLHQLRGRIGRGADNSMCVLMYSSPLSVNGKERIDIMRQTTDGFVIAKKDLELRGVGEVLGVNQSGMADFKIANLVRDEYLLDDANKLARDYFKQSVKEQDDFIHRWIMEKNLSLANS